MCFGKSKKTETPAAAPAPVKPEPTWYDTANLDTRRTGAQPAADQAGSPVGSLGGGSPAGPGTISGTY